MYNTAVRSSTRVYLGKSDLLDLLSRAFVGEGRDIMKEYTTAFCHPMLMNISNRVAVMVNFYVSIWLNYSVLLFGQTPVV